MEFSRYFGVFVLRRNQPEGVNKQPLSPIRWQCRAICCYVEPRKVVCMSKAALYCLYCWNLFVFSDWVCSLPTKWTRMGLDAS